MVLQKETHQNRLGIVAFGGSKNSLEQRNEAWPAPGDGRSNSSAERTSGASAARTTGAILQHFFDFSPGAMAACQGTESMTNSPGGIRTCDQSVNSRPLYH